MTASKSTAVPGIPPNVYRITEVLNSTTHALFHTSKPWQYLERV